MALQLTPMMGTTALSLIWQYGRLSSRTLKSELGRIVQGYNLSGWAMKPETVSAVISRLLADHVQWSDDILSSHVLLNDSRISARVCLRTRKIQKRNRQIRSTRFQSGFNDWGMTALGGHAFSGGDSSDLESSSTAFRDEEAAYFEYGWASDLKPRHR